MKCICRAYYECCGSIMAAVQTIYLAISRLLSLSLSVLHNKTVDSALEKCFHDELGGKQAGTSYKFYLSNPVV